MNAEQINALAGVIEEARTRLHIPGAAFGILHEGGTYGAGCGVTSVETPLPVESDPLLPTGPVSNTRSGPPA